MTEARAMDPRLNRGQIHYRYDSTRSVFLYWYA